MNFVLLVSAHISLALIAAIFFYWISVDVHLKRVINKKTLVFKSVVAVVASTLVWLSEVVYLSGYYVGKEGFNTPPNVTELLPTFAFVRAILLPLIAAVAAILLVMILFRGEYVSENKKLKGIIVTLSIIGWVGASALMLFGVLLP